MLFQHRLFSNRTKYFVNLAVRFQYKSHKTERISCLLTYHRLVEHVLASSSIYSDLQFRTLFRYTLIEYVLSSCSSFFFLHKPWQGKTLKKIKRRRDQLNVMRYFLLFNRVVFFPLCKVALTKSALFRVYLYRHLPKPNLEQFWEFLLFRGNFFF